MELEGSSFPLSFLMSLTFGGGGGGGGRIVVVAVVDADVVDTGGEDVDDTIPPDGTRNSFTFATSVFLKTTADCIATRKFVKYKAPSILH